MKYAEIQQWHYSVAVGSKAYETTLHWILKDVLFFLRKWWRFLSAFGWKNSLIVFTGTVFCHKDWWELQVGLQKFKWLKKMNQFSWEEYNLTRWGLAERLGVGIGPHVHCNKGNTNSVQAAPACVCETLWDYCRYPSWLPFPGLGRIREESFVWFGFVSPCSCFVLSN